MPNGDGWKSFSNMYLYSILLHILFLADFNHFGFIRLMFVTSSILLPTVGDDVFYAYSEDVGVCISTMILGGRYAIKFLLFAFSKFSFYISHLK